MFYRKNVRTTERAFRVITGCALIACGWTIFGPSAPGWVSMASGMLISMTGIAGFCPACAVAGRQAVTENPAAK